MKYAIISSSIACMLSASALSAGMITFSPNTLADFGPGVVAFDLNSVTSTSTISSITGGLRVETNISGVTRALFSHDLIGAAVDPSTQGAITDIDFTIDIADPGLGDSDSPIHFGLVQGANTYFYGENSGSGVDAFSFRNSGSTSFANFDKNGLVASDFGLWDGASPTGINAIVNMNANPDFTGTGGDIQFIYAITAATGGSTLVRFTDFRNSEIVVTTVPEPSTFALLAGALTLGLVMLRRRRS